MRRFLMRALTSAREMTIAGGPFVLLAVALVVLAFRLLDPNPPRRVVMATGPADSAFAEFGARYRDALRRHGIELELRNTDGTLANARALRDPDGDVAFGFVQAGTLGGGDEAGEANETNEGLVSLGSLFYEPVWIFYRQAEVGPMPQVGKLRGRSVNVGVEGSGGPALFGRLLAANRIEPQDVDVRRLGETAAVIELIEGRIDAVAFASAPESPLIRMLLQTPGIALYEFAQAEAYSRRLPFLSSVVLPRGIVDIGRDMPHRDRRLIATTTMLVARDGTHPALLQLMVQAAAEIHGGAGWFQRAGEFPSTRGGELPVAAEARRFYRDGPPLLQRYLPFWLANLVDRMWVALAAIIAVLIPLSRLVPPLYEYRVRARVFRWYGQLRRIEDELIEIDAAPAGRGDAAAGDGRAAPGRDEKRARLRERLDDIEARVERVNVPLSHADELYALRSHIAMVRRRIG